MPRRQNMDNIHTKHTKNNYYRFILRNRKLRILFCLVRRSFYPAAHLVDGLFIQNRALDQSVDIL